MALVIKTNVQKEKKVDDDFFKNIKEEVMRECEKARQIIIHQTGRDNSQILRKDLFRLINITPTNKDVIIPYLTKCGMTIVDKLSESELKKKERKKSMFHDIIGTRTSANFIKSNDGSYTYTTDTIITRDIENSFTESLENSDNKFTAKPSRSTGAAIDDVYIDHVGIIRKKEEVPKF